MDDQHRAMGYLGVAADRSNRAIRTLIPGSIRRIDATAVRWA
jgi:hypothetical protein